MNQAIITVLDALRSGYLDKAYEFKAYLNEMALYLYYKPELTAEDQEDLHNIITICNICYNDTDRELLPIEDGVYDLILEKYKTYNPQFQVGADVLSFEASKKSVGIYVEKPMREAITFMNPVSDEDVYFLDDIVIDERRFIDRRDFENRPTPPSEIRITKRHHDTAHNHPELVGTLDKCKFVLDRDAIARGVFDDSNVKTVERDFFQDHIKRGILDPNKTFDVVLELKYDGISVEADCTDEVVSARSRGDTGVGQASDLTPFLKGYKFPHRPKGSPMIGVKFEAIITQYDLPFFNKAKGYEYKNCRSAIVGLLSSSDAWKYRDFITLVPLAVEQEVFEKTCNSDRVQEIQYLNYYFVSKGCPMRWTYVNGSYVENLFWINLFASNAEMMRYAVPFMYDGIVVSYRDPNIRKALGRENSINKYSIAVKFNPLKKETVFRGYSYTVGQDGSITPMIHYDPVEFYGTIHSKSSGHSYARFQELQLRIGDMIDVEYVNDVMPYVTKPINDWNIENEQKVPTPVYFPSHCPVCGAEVVISDSGKSAKCPNPDCGGRQLARMVNSCAKLGMDGFGESTIAQIGKYHLHEMFELLTHNGWEEELRIRGFGPVEAMNIHNQVIGLMNREINEAQLLGSVGFTGISNKTWEIVLQMFDYNTLRTMFNEPDQSEEYRKNIVRMISSIKGIGPITADTISREFKYFQNDVDWLIQHGRVIKYIPRTGKKIRFTGFRDKALCEYLNSIGFLADDNADVSKDTHILLVPDTSFQSRKTQKAEQLGIMILPVNEFRENIENYR